MGAAPADEESRESATPAQMLSTRRSRSWVSWALLASILVLAAVLRVLFLSGIEADFDELWHLELSTGRGTAHNEVPLNALVTVPPLTSLTASPPWYVIPTTLDGVTHPPLYLLVLRGWRSIAGESIMAGRMLSVVLSLACIVMLFVTMRPLHGEAAALWGCLILALSASQVEIAQEVRGYPLLILECLCAAAVMLRIERMGPSTGRMLLLSIATLAALFTHYFAAPALLAICMYAILRFRGRARWAVPVMMAAMVLLFAAVWMPFAIRQLHAFREAAGPGALGAAASNHITRTLTLAAQAPLRLLFTPPTGAEEAAMLSAAVFVLPLLLMRLRPQLLLWWLWLVLVIGFMFALDLMHTTRHLEQLRHTVLAAPAMCALLVLLVAGQRPLLAHGAPLLLALACVAALGSNSGFRQRYAALGRSVAAAAASSHEPLVIYSDPDRKWWSGWLLLSCAHYSGTFPRPVLRLSAPATPEQLAELKRWEGCWLVRASKELRFAEILPGATIEQAGQYDDSTVGSTRHVRWTATTSPSP